MSYDLFFRARDSGATITRDEFEGYFAERPRYQVKDSQAFYGNEDTGVYFVFEFIEPDSDDDADPSLTPVSFRLNYYRPHPFGLESEPEVRSFVSRFDLLVSDSQIAGMGEGEYSTEGFLRGWNAGNQFGYRAIGNDATEAVNHSLPAARINSVWRWNLAHQARQTRLGENIFVPRIFFFILDDQVRTGVAWADGIPILLPEVDLVLVPRKQLAPRRLFRRPAEDIVVFAWGQIEHALNRFQKLPGEPACFELFYNEIPSEIEWFIRSAKPPAAMPQGLGFDQVLDRELLDTAGRTV